MLELFLSYYLAIGVIHGANPAMGWLLGVYYALTRRDIIHLYLAEAAVVIGHILSVFLVLSPLYYFYRVLTIPSLLVAIMMLLYIAFRFLRKGSHRYFGLKLRLRKIFALGFLFQLLHAGPLPLLSIFCLTQSPSLGYNSLFTLVTAHLLGVVLAIFTLSTLTYLIGVGLLRRIWINFEKVWLTTLALTVIFLLFFQSLAFGPESLVIVFIGPDFKA